MAQLLKCRACGEEQLWDADRRDLQTVSAELAEKEAEIARLKKALGATAEDTRHGSVVEMLSSMLKRQVEDAAHLKKQIARLTARLDEAREREKVAHDLLDRWLTHGEDGEPPPILESRDWCDLATDTEQSKGEALHKEQGADTADKAMAGETKGPLGDEDDACRTDRLTSASDSSPDGKRVADQSAPDSPVCKWEDAGVTAEGTTYWDTDCGGRGFGIEPVGNCWCGKPITTDREEG